MKGKKSMKRLYMLFEKLTDKEIMAQLLSELQEEEWDDWLPEYYGQYLFMKRVRKRDLNYVFTDLERFTEDGMDCYQVQAFRVDSEVFELEEKVLNMMEITKIMNLYIPECMREANSDLQIVCDFIRAMSEDFCMFSRAREDEEFFASVKEIARKVGKTDNNDNIDYKQMKSVIKKECRTLAQTPFYTLTWNELLQGKRFPEYACKHVNPINPPDIARCREFHEKIIARMRLLGLAHFDKDMSPIVVSDEGLGEEDIPRVYLENDEFGSLGDCAHIGLGFFERKIKVRLRRSLTKDEITALIYLYILYPLRMERQNRKKIF